MNSKHFVDSGNGCEGFRCFSHQFIHSEVPTNTNFHSDYTMKFLMFITLILQHIPLYAIYMVKYLQENLYTKMSVSIQIVLHSMRYIIFSVGIYKRMGSMAGVGSMSARIWIFPRKTYYLYRNISKTIIQ